MYIAVCDDEKIYSENIRDLIIEYFNDKKIPFCMDVFTNPEKIINSKNNYDLVFLDIEMGKISGLQVAKKLRERKSDLLIFFISHFQFYLDHAMNMSPFRYLTKPVESARLFAGLSVAVRKWKQAQKRISLTEYKSKIHLSINIYDILLIENANRKTKVITKNNCLYVYEKYKELRSELISYEDFCESHQSFTINLNHVAFHDRENIHLEYGHNTYAAHISRRKLSDFHFKFLKFAGDMK